MPRPVLFSATAPRGDRVYHVGEDDVRVVLSRLPEEVCQRLRRVHFNDRSRGAKVLGYVNRGRREIALCALPPRISLTRFLTRGQSPAQFGARRGAQWPLLAIRRFLLYDVFLHELGHLQVIHEGASSNRRKFAAETRAQEFGMTWCRKLWAQPFDHPDPVHQPPTPLELARLEDGTQECFDFLLRHFHDDLALFEDEPEDHIYAMAQLARDLLLEIREPQANRKFLLYCLLDLLDDARAEPEDRPRAQTIQGFITRLRELS